MLDYKSFLIPFKSKITEIYNTDFMLDDYDKSQLDYIIKTIDNMLTNIISINTDSIYYLISEIITTASFQVNTELLKFIRPFWNIVSQEYGVTHVDNNL